MDDLLKQISGTMAQYEMAPVGEKILAAVSGGADSVCMMLALKELGYSVHAVHVEHGIRGQESLEDLAFTQSVCRREQIGLTVRQIDAPLLAKNTGRSLEEAARDERARILLETAESLHIRVIATAHHMNDQAETVLWNLVRGSSVAGLCGILPVREVEAGASGRDPAEASEGEHAEASEGEQAEASERDAAEGARKIRLIRPLIHCSRQQIEDWLEARGQAYRVDRTNLDPFITRNALRLQILPQLERLNSQAQRHIAQAASDIEQAERCLDKMTERVYAKAQSRTEEGDVQILLEALEGEEDLIRQRVFHRALGEALGGLRDVTRQHVDALAALSRMDNGRRITLPGGNIAVREEGVVVFRKSPDAGAEDAHFAEEIRIDHDGVYETPSGMRLTVRFGVFEGGNIEKKKYTKLLAYDTMTPYLTLRTRRAGDWLAVNASGGRKKLKEYLIEEKVPRDQRDQIPLIAQGSHVLWVVGGRISEGARVREGLHYAEITVENLTESRDAADRGEGRMKETTRVLIPEDRIEERIKELGRQISQDYAGKQIHLIGILKGSIFFMCELAKHITIPVTMDFMSVSSYGSGTRTTGVVKLIKDLDEPIEGKHVLVVEDIIDSGYTLSYLLQNLSSRHPASIRLCTLLDKPERREVDVDVDYQGFRIPDEFVIGYGLDYDQRYRNLPYVGVLSLTEE